MKIIFFSLLREDAVFDNWSREYSLLLCQTDAYCICTMGINIPDRMHCDKVTRDCEERELSDVLKARSLRWFGHVKRKVGDRLWEEFKFLKCHAINGLLDQRS